MKCVLLSLVLTGCYLHSYPITPASAESATFAVFGPSTDPGYYTQGTAWAVAPHALVTAGHVCRGIADPGTDGRMALVSTSGRIFTVAAVYWTTEGRPDLCVLKTGATLNSFLHLETNWPTPGTPLFYVGFPASKFTHVDGVAMKVDSDGEGLAAMDAYLGASGSAIIRKAGGVVGVVVASPCTEDCTVVDVHTTIAVRVEDLRSFLTAAGVAFESIPVMPGDPPEWAPGAGG